MLDERLDDTGIEPKEIIRRLSSDDRSGSIGNIYCMRDEDGLYKIGVTRGLRDRVTAIKGKTGKNITVVWCFRMYSAFVKERLLHEWFRGKWIEGEWFALNETDVEDAKKILSNHVIGEC